MPPEPLLGSGARAVDLALLFNEICAQARLQKKYLYKIPSDNLISDNIPFKSRTRISVKFMVCMRSSLSPTSRGCSGSLSRSFKHVIYLFTVIQSAGPSSSSSLSSPKASNALFSISYLVYFNIRSCKKPYWNLYLGHK